MTSHSPRPSPSSFSFSLARAALPHLWRCRVGGCNDGQRHKGGDEAVKRRHRREGERESGSIRRRCVTLFARCCSCELSCPLMPFVMPSEEPSTRGAACPCTRAGASPRHCPRCGGRRGWSVRERHREMKNRGKESAKTHFSALVDFKRAYCVRHRELSLRTVSTASPPPVPFLS